MKKMNQLEKAIKIYESNYEYLKMREEYFNEEYQKLYKRPSILSWTGVASIGIGQLIRSCGYPEFGGVIVAAGAFSLCGGTGWSAFNAIGDQAESDAYRSPNTSERLNYYRKEAEEYNQILDMLKENSTSEKSLEYLSDNRLEREKDRHFNC